MHDRAAGGEFVLALRAEVLLVCDDLALEPDAIDVMEKAREERRKVFEGVSS